jgi:hypothetical protein
LKITLGKYSVHRKQWAHSSFLTNEKDQYLLALDTTAQKVYPEIVSADWIELLKFVILHRVFETCAVPSSRGT